MTKNHRTKKVAIKTEDIDIGIVTVVKWLNTFSSVVTKFSCEGYGNSSGAYIMFTCEDNLDIINILRLIGNSVKMEVSLEYENRSSLRYTLYFSSKNILDSISACLKNREFGENQ